MMIRHLAFILASKIMIILVSSRPSIPPARPSSVSHNLEIRRGDPEPVNACSVQSNIVACVDSIARTDPGITEPAATIDTQYSIEVDDTTTDPTGQAASIQIDTAGCTSLTPGTNIGPLNTLDKPLPDATAADIVGALASTVEEVPPTTSSNIYSQGLSLVSTNAQLAAKEAQTFLNLTDRQVTHLRRVFKKSGLKLGAALVLKASTASIAWYTAVVTSNQALSAGITDEKILLGALAAYVLIASLAIYDFLQQTRKESSLLIQVTWQKLWALLVFLCGLRRPFGGLRRYQGSTDPQELVPLLPQLANTEDLNHGLESTAQGAKLLPSEGDQCHT